MEDRAADADRYEVITGGYDEALFGAAAIRPGDQVLDIGCGYGRTTLRAARLAGAADEAGGARGGGGERGGGGALGNDVAAPLLAEARRAAAAEGVRNVRFEDGDAETHPFAAEAFDVAMSRFGTMFFADQVAAFGNIARALRPGGRLACTVTADPAENDLTRVLAQVLASHLPARMDEPGAPGLSSLAEPERIHAVLEASGWREVTVEPATAVYTIGGDLQEAGAFLLRWGAVRDSLPVGEPERMNAIADRMAAALRPYERDGAVSLRGTAWLISARRA